MTSFKTGDRVRVIDGGDRDGARDDSADGLGTVIMTDYEPAFDTRVRWDRDNDSRAYWYDHEDLELVPPAVPADERAALVAAQATAFDSQEITHRAWRDAVIAASVAEDALTAYDTAHREPTFAEKDLERLRLAYRSGYHTVNGKAAHDNGLIELARILSDGVTVPETAKEG